MSRRYPYVNFNRFSESVKLFRMEHSSDWARCMALLEKHYQLRVNEVCKLDFYLPTNIKVWSDLSRFQLINLLAGAEIYSYDQSEELVALRGVEGLINDMGLSSTEPLPSREIPVLCKYLRDIHDVDSSIPSIFIKNLPQKAMPVQRATVLRNPLAVNGITQMIQARAANMAPAITNGPIAEASSSSRSQSQGKMPLPPPATANWPFESAPTQVAVVQAGVAYVSTPRAQEPDTTVVPATNAPPAVDIVPAAPDTQGTNPVSDKRPEVTPLFPFTGNPEQSRSGPAAVIGTFDPPFQKTKEKPTEEIVPTGDHVHVPLPPLPEASQMAEPIPVADSQIAVEVKNELVDDDDATNKKETSKTNSTSAETASGASDPIPAPVKFEKGAPTPNKRARGEKTVASSAKKPKNM